MVMHRHGRAGRNTDFKHAYECVLKNYSVAVGRSLHCVVAVGEVRFVLSVDVIVSCEEDKATND